MTTPPFNAHVIANAKLGDPGLDPSVIAGTSYEHQTPKGTRETMMTLLIGRVSYQCADPDWFRHLIDQANAALTSAGYHPHTTPANDQQPAKDGKDAA